MMGMPSLAKKNKQKKKKHDEMGKVTRHIMKLY